MQTKEIKLTISEEDLCKLLCDTYDIDAEKGDTVVLTSRPMVRDSRRFEEVTLTVTKASVADA